MESTSEMKNAEEKNVTCVLDEFSISPDHPSVWSSHAVPSLTGHHCPLLVLLKNACFFFLPTAFYCAIAFYFLPVIYLYSVSRKWLKAFKRKIVRHLKFHWLLMFQINMKLLGFYFSSSKQTCSRCLLVEDRCFGTTRWQPWCLIAWVTLILAA